ncbi:hypothetical protein XI07_15800 [Bradyrhizobium sp. CCBAU 11445]|uniref:hypothetical protein n=1 Tax=unclassified Bradyrhizobium TaxID=2631580 RepID=UPI0023061424|nr:MULTISPECIES: hypothetical protein [unclassified Bradyrhizobium]MDA9483448.1 hypothetical protein [Bradyrhizobium sp. CCBAU 11445]MDA9523317.1 hypothetical protein [Bradyrhizobium sp. CCBAU 11434]
MSTDVQKIIVEVSKDDEELLRAVEQEFGVAAQKIEVSNFDAGVVGAVQIAIPIVAATAPFLLKYFTIRTPRVIVEPTGKIAIHGYKAEEVAILLDKTKFRRKSPSKG